MKITPIPGWPDYGITTDGCVYRIVQGGARRRVPFQLKPRVDRSPGYVSFSLCRDGKSYSHSLHVLLLETFVGPRPYGYEACHNDGDPSNNSLENLRWDTKRNNNLDRHKHGTVPLGRDVHIAVLSKGDVEWIRAYPQRPSAIAEMAARLQVCQTTIWNVLHRRTWRHA